MRLPKTDFPQTVKSDGENLRLRSQSCLDLTSVCVCVCVFSETHLTAYFFFFFFLRDRELVKSFDTLGFTGV